jgi:hypothetical protein
MRLTGAKGAAPARLSADKFAELVRPLVEDDLADTRAQ